MTIGYAEAGELLADLARAHETFDGDLVVSLFSADAEYHEDPFGPPIVGHNAIRAYWLESAATQDQVEFTIERHLVSGDTIVAIWHLSYVLREDTVGAAFGHGGHARRRDRATAGVVAREPGRHRRRRTRGGMRR
jgi:hypothetical protein